MATQKLRHAGQELAHYRLVEKVGDGGMGVVWKALDRSLERHVALKFLPDDVAGDPDRLERFEQEACLVASLNHPNIVTIYAVEESDGSRFLAMELIKGRSLRQLIPEGGLPVPDLLDLAIPMADALALAHDRGITHGDLKPANIMQCDEGRLKILDFGLARSLGPRARSIDISTLPTETLSEKPHKVSGTLPYMSPEQIRGEVPDHRCDIFALGIVLFEMSTGRRPFRGDSPADLIASILKDEPPLVTELRSDLPRHLARVIKHCLRKDRSHRLQSALDLRNDLEDIRSENAPTKGQEEASIGVLPFVDMSAEKGQDYFCEGMAEEIINALTQIQGLHVASRTSSFRFKHAALGSRQIGRQLGVRTLLEGSVRKVDQRLRITAELTDARLGFQLWSGRYDRKLEDIFAIQDDIAGSIVEALRLTLTPKERDALHTAHTTDVEAYEYYLRGRKYYYQYRRRGIEFALQMFSRAIDLDASYGLAYAGIADCCWFLYMYVDRAEEHRRRAESASLKALELAPDSSQVHASRGVALSLAGHHDDAEQEFETAIRLDHRLFEAHYFYARDAFVQGKLHKAIRLYEQARRVRPEDYQAPLLMAQIYDDLGRTDTARETRIQGVRLAEAHLQLHPDDTRALYLAANGLVAIGVTQRGLEWARRALEMEPDESMLLYNVGCIQSLAGQVDEAIETLEKAARLGLRQREWYEMDSNLDPLREHPRFRTMLRSLD